MPTTGPDPDKVLDAVLAAFNAAMQGYLPALLSWGTALLSAVVFAGLAFALLHAITNHDWFGMFMSMGWAFARVAVLYMLYENFESIGSIFSVMGQVISQSVVRGSSTTPSNTYSMGLNIIGLLFSSRHWGAWFNLIADAQFLILIVLTWAAWLAIAIRLLFVQIEVEWVFVKGATTVCFAAFPHTFSTLENWAVQMLRTAIKLIATLMILAIGIALAKGWTTTLAGLGTKININPIAYGMIQLTEAWILGWAVWSLPQKAASIISSSGSNGGADNDSGEGLHKTITGGLATAGKALIG